MAQPTRYKVAAGFSLRGTVNGLSIVCKQGRRLKSAATQRYVCVLPQPA